MDFYDTTVIIPAKDEPAVYKVTNDVLSSLKDCKVLVLYNGYSGKHLKFKNSRVRAYPVPMGKGRVIIFAQKKKLVKTEILCFIDGDATYEPKNLRKMIAMIRADEYDMVLGNRFGGLREKSMPKFIRFGNKVLSGMANSIYGMNIIDSQTGLRAIRTSAFQSLELTEPEFGIEEEMNIKMSRSGYRIAEVAADYYVRIGETKQRKFVDGIKLFLINFRFVSYRPKNLRR